MKKEVWINVNKSFEKKHKMCIAVNGVHFPKKIRTELIMKDGKQVQALVRHHKTHVYVEHEQSEDGQLLYVNPCGGLVKQCDLKEVALSIMGGIRFKKEP